MIRPFRLNGQAIKHARLTDSQIADVDHLLSFALAFGDDLPRFHRHELAEVMFRVAQRVAQAADSFAAYWSGSDTPFQKCFVCPANRSFVIFIGRCPNAGEFPAVDWRDLVDLRAPAAAGPFAAKGARIFLGQIESLENRLHPYLRRPRQYFRTTSIASSTTSAVMSSAGRKRIEFSPERSVSTPASNKPFHISSRALASGRSKARNIPRPRTALMKSNSFCSSRS